MGTNGQLTQKQRRFCEEYLVDLNATQAAIRAGYAKRSASSIGHENRKKPKIQRYIIQTRQERNLRTQVTVDRIVMELAKITFAEKGVKTGYKLKALDMLAKHVGLYDKEARKYLERLKEEEEQLRTQKKDLTEKEEAIWAILILMDPRDCESIRKAWERHVRKNTDLREWGKSQDIYKDFDLIEFTRQQGKIENLKRAVLGGIDRVFERW